MTPNIPLAVRHLIEEYRSFLRTSYRFLDDHLRQQFEAHLAQADVVVKGPYVTLARDFALGPTLRELVQEGTTHPDVLKARRPFAKNHLYLKPASPPCLGCLKTKRPIPFSTVDVI